MGLGERVCGRIGLAVRGGMEGLVDKGLELRGGTGGAFRSRHSSLTWCGKRTLQVSNRLIGPRCGFGDGGGRLKVRLWRQLCLAGLGGTLSSKGSG